MTYFVHDPEGKGFTFHDTERKAREEVEAAFEYEQGYAGSDGWSDHVTEICWGRVMGRVTEVGRRPDPDGRFDELIDYRLKPTQEDAP